MGGAQSWTQLRDSTSTTELKGVRNESELNEYKIFFRNEKILLEFDIDFGFLTLNVLNALCVLNYAL